MKKNTGCGKVWGRQNALSNDAVTARNAIGYPLRAHQITAIDGRGHEVVAEEHRLEQQSGEHRRADRREQEVGRGIAPHAPGR